MGIQINGQTDTVTATDGSINVGGDVTIPGVLTYEDVTNIDSVGIVTARAGIRVTGDSIHVESSEDRLLYLKSTDANAYLTFEDTDSSSGFANRVGTVSDGLYFSTGGGGERLRITSDGKVGIGTVTPSRGGLHIHKASTAELHLTDDTTGSGSGDGLTVFSTISSAGVWYRENANLRFATNNTERMIITSGGNVDINGTPPWTVTGGNYRNLSISGNDASSSGFLWLGNGAAATNADFDLGRVNFVNGTNIIAQIKGTTQTSANDDGRISFLTKSTGSNITEKLRITSDGNIGINNQNPGDKLSISGGNLGIYNTGNNHGNVYFYKDGTAKGWLKYRGNDDKLVIGNVTDAINVKTSGNVGVGNADPTQAKFVAQTASGMSIAAVKDNTGASMSLGGVTQPRILMEAGASASQFKLYTASGSSYSSADWRQRLHLTPTNASVSSAGSGANGIGCFGIADNSPDSRALALSIGGGSGLYGIEDSRPMVYLQRSYGIGGGSSTDETTLEISAPGSYNSAGIVYGIKSRAQHNLNGSHYAGHFEAHGSQYSANGTSALYAKTTKLDTNGSGDVIAFRADASITTGISNTGAAIAGYFASGNNVNGKPIVCQNGYTTNSYSNQIIFRKHNGSGIVDVGSIKSNNSNTQYNTSSDYRLKENIVSLTGAIDRLKQLQPKRFNFIGIDETIDGFIAHEVNPVAPYAVSGEKDAVKKELVLDEDGKEQFDENGEIIHREVIDPQGVDYGKLTTLTIAALQEALAKIETLEAKVAVLEGS